MTSAASVINLSSITRGRSVNSIRISDLYYINISQHSTMTISLEGYNTSVMMLDTVGNGVHDTPFNCLKTIFLGAASGSAEVRYFENVTWDYHCYGGCSKQQNIDLTVLFDAKIAGDEISLSNPLMITLDVEHIIDMCFVNSCRQKYPPEHILSRPGVN